MAKSLVYRRPHRLGKIAAEIMAGVPELRPVAGAGGDLVAVASFSGDGVTLTVGCPDNTPEAAVAAIVAAHDPTTPSAAEARDATRQAHEDTWRAELQTLLVKLDAGTATATEQRRVAALLVRIVLRLLD